MITIPTLAQLRADIISKIESEYAITLPSYGKNFLRVLAGVQAGMLWLYYKYLATIQKNILPDTADPEEMGGTLDRFGRIKLGRNRYPAKSGSYTVQVNGVFGSVIPASTTFKSDDNSLNAGRLFILDVAYSIAVGTNTITLRALDSGTNAKLSIGDTLTITSPLAGINSDALVTVELIEPKESETVEDYRRKIIESYRLEVQGGAGADYRLWAYDVQGVKNSYPFAGGVTNSVNLYIESTIASSTDGKGTPSAITLQDVKDAIELPTLTRPSRKPLTVDVNYIATTPLDVKVKINNFVGSVADKLLIDNAIESYLKSLRPFVASIDVLSEKNDVLNNNSIISIILQSVPTVTFTSVDLIVNAVAVSNYTFTNGDIPYLMPINYA